MQYILISITKNMADQEEKIKERRSESQERELQMRIAGIKSIISVLSRGINRHIKSGDPVIRSTLLFDKLCLVVDLVSALSINYNSDLPEDLIKEITEASKNLSAELDYVFNYILSPQYSPDHPYGNSIMKKSAEHFDNVNNNSPGEDL